MAVPILDGLNSADVAQRVARGAVNTVPVGSGRSVAGILRDNLFTRFNALIAALAALVLIFGSWLDATFGFVIVVNSAVGVIQELRAKRTLDRLAVLGRAPVRVRRDGAEHAIAPEELVVDDLILLASGETVPVDAEVVRTESLEIDESLLTGESDPIAKEPRDVVLSGSFAVAGTGEVRATKVGAAAYAASLVSEASRFSLAESEIVSGINRFLRLLTWVIVPVGLLLTVRQLTIDEPLPNAIVSSVAGIVPMIPEGLVLMTSIAFALGVIRLGRRQCLVQELPAVEILARVDTLCLDKTGTLTEPGMTLREIIPPSADVSQVLAALAAADSHPNPTLRAIAESAGPPPPWPITEMVPFSSARKYCGAVFDGRGAFLLGAPDVLLSPGEPDRARAEELGTRGLRVLALVHADTLDTASRTSRALIVLDQRLRPTAAATLRYFASQDIDVKVISGDNAAAVGAIAGNLGIPGANAPIDARTRADSLSTDVIDHAVFGRVTPQQKREMVAALKADGRTVAMTGDGVNDALALKDADLGIAMGSGSGAARAVAKVVLLDDEFATLPHVLAEGRRVLANIERVANLFLTKTIYSVLLALLIGVAGLPFPFLPRHVTIVAALTIGIPAFFLALAPSNERARPGFVTRVLQFAIPAGIACATATFISYAMARAHTASDLTQDRTTAALTLFIVAFLALLLVARPLNPAKSILLSLIGVAAVLIAALPPARTVAELDFGDLHNNMVAVGVAAFAGLLLCVGLRLVRWGHTSGGSGHPMNELVETNSGAVSS